MGSVRMVLPNPHVLGGKHVEETTQATRSASVVLLLVQFLYHSVVQILCLSSSISVPLTDAIL